LDGQDLITAAWVAGGALVALVVLALVLGRRRKPSKSAAKGPVRGVRPDRDILRAEFAIAYRGLEQRAEALAETARRLRIDNARLRHGGPDGSPVPADGAGGGGGGDAGRVAALEAALAEKTAALAAAGDELAAAKAAAEAARSAAAPAANAPAAAVKAADSSGPALSAARSEIARLAAEIAALKGELDRKAGVITAAEAALSSATAALGDRDQELAEVTAASEAKAAEAARRAQEAATAGRAAAEAKAALAQMQDALREAREESDSRRIEAATASVRADALADELAELRSGAMPRPAGPPGPSADEVARLREELGALAAEVVVVAAEQLGRDGPAARAVDDLVAGEPMVPPAAGAPPSLAERIRRRRNREPA